MKSFKLFEESQNRGINYEAGFTKHLFKHGLMAHKHSPKTGGGNDFHLINKKQHVIHRGKVYDGRFVGEAKMDASRASFGQMALNWDKDVKRWGISPDAASKRPEFAQHVEKASITVDGKKKSLLQHINDTVGAPKKGHIKTIYSDRSNMAPAHAYGRDHGVDVIHIGKKGTFAFGHGEKKDKTRIGLPKLTGHGMFEVRRKYPKNGNSLHVSFKVRGGSVPKSHIDLENEDHLEKVKKALGHTV